MIKTKENYTYELPELIEFNDIEIVMTPKEVGHELALEFDEFRQALLELKKSIRTCPQRVDMYDEAQVGMAEMKPRIIPEIQGSIILAEQDEIRRQISAYNNIHILLTKGSRLRNHI